MVQWGIPRWASELSVFNRDGHSWSASSYKWQTDQQCVTSHLGILEAVSTELARKWYRLSDEKPPVSNQRQDSCCWELHGEQRGLGLAGLKFMVSKEAWVQPGSSSCCQQCSCSCPPCSFPYLLTFLSISIPETKLRIKARIYWIHFRIWTHGIDGKHYGNTPECSCSSSSIPCIFSVLDHKQTWAF